VAEKKDILVLEDNEDLRELYKIVLNEAGYNTHCARNTEEAWGYLKSKKIDLMILDIMLLGKMGHVFLFKLREMAEYCDLPVIVATVLKDIGDSLESLEHTSYLVKPFSKEALLDEITKMLH